MTSGDELRRSPLHEVHEGLDAKMVPFAGFEMPIQYPTGIRAEHRAVREGVGLFDVSHMGEYEVSGPDAEAFLQRTTVNDVSKLKTGRAQYSAMCREDGGTLDDLLIYRTGDRRFMVVVNAANRDSDLEWLLSWREEMDVEIEDRSEAIGLLALQGPKAEGVLAPLTSLDLGEIRFYGHASGRVDGVEALVSRTGYTGEDGFELYVNAEDAPGLWRTFMDTGREAGITPAGLGARDSLRLEAGLLLYGSDLDETRTPVEAGVGWMVKVDKGDFVGREVLARQKAEGVPERLTGFRLDERGFPRPGYPLVHEGQSVGEVTSGVLSPSLGVGIGFGYLPTELSEPGTEVGVEVRGRTIPARVERPPFYKEGSLKR